MSGQGEGGNAASVSGAVHRRDGSDESSSPDQKCQRIAADAERMYEHPQVLSYAARGRNGRFYIPSTENFFGEVQVNNIMFDSRCSTLLLPYPLETGFSPEFLSNNLYSWVIVGTSRGAGAVHSLVLKIYSRIGRQFPVTLAGKAQLPPGVPKLRFQLGSRAVNQVLETPQLLALLDEGCVNMLIGFRTEIGDRTIEERNCALLGQSYFANVSQFQTGDVTLAISPNFPQNENLWEIAGRYHMKLGPMVREFENWSDLEQDRR